MCTIHAIIILHKNIRNPPYAPAKKVGLEIFYAVIAHVLIPVFYYHLDSRVVTLLLTFCAVIAPFDNAGK